MLAMIISDIICISQAVFQTAAVYDTRAYWQIILYLRKGTTQNFWLLWLRNDRRYRKQILVMANFLNGLKLNKDDSSITSGLIENKNEYPCFKIM